MYRGKNDSAVALPNYAMLHYDLLICWNVYIMALVMMGE
jgi:hypothetical protein